MPREAQPSQSRRPLADSNAARRRQHETVTQRARRYQDAIKFISGRPDSETLWPIARTALSYVLEGKDINEAWDEACADYGVRP